MPETLYVNPMPNMTCTAILLRNLKKVIKSATVKILQIIMAYVTFITKKKKRLVMEIDLRKGNSPT